MNGEAKEMEIASSFVHMVLILAPSEDKLYIVDRDNNRIQVFFLTRMVLFFSNGVKRAKVMENLRFLTVLMLIKKEMFG